MVAEMKAGAPRYWLVELARMLSAIAPSLAARIIDAETDRLERPAVEGRIGGVPYVYGRSDASAKGFVIHHP